MSVLVNESNFVAAETARMFDGIIARARGVNRLAHRRLPTAVDQQGVVRMNRDTLYSAAIVDVTRAASITLPETGGRYQSAAVIDGQHYVNEVFHGPGTFDVKASGSPCSHVAILVRTFVDPHDRQDIAAATDLQDRIDLVAESSVDYCHEPYDKLSRRQVAESLAGQGVNRHDTTAMFGRKQDVDTTAHLVGTALGWGGLPESEAFYVFETSPHEARRHRIRFGEIPVNGFWSFTVYDQQGYLSRDTAAASSLNSVTATRDLDGSVTVYLEPEAERRKHGANTLGIFDGWNYVLRLYQPQQVIVDKRWQPPRPELVLAE